MYPTTLLESLRKLGINPSYLGYDRELGHIILQLDSNDMPMRRANGVYRTVPYMTIRMVDHVNK